MTSDAFESACRTAGAASRELDEAARHAYIDPERYSTAKANANIAFDALVEATRAELERINRHALPLSHTP